MVRSRMIPLPNYQVETLCKLPVHEDFLAHIRKKEFKFIFKQKTVLKLIYSVAVVFPNPFFFFLIHYRQLNLNQSIYHLRRMRMR